MLKTYDFECQRCEAVFTDTVEGCDGQPEECPDCKGTVFKKLLSTPNIPKKIVIDYPGSKQFKAGYVHTHARPAEKKESQISMHGTKGIKK